MKAAVYHGPGSITWDEVARPTLIADTDAIVRVEATTICGTDLHILKGDLPSMIDGRIVGHEAVGTVEEIGAGVKNVKVGDRVLVSCVSACGSCRYCRELRFGQCLNGGGWILGNEIDGTQAEFVRTPFADNSLYPVPAGVSDEAVLMLADILPTAYEVGVLNGKVQPGEAAKQFGADMVFNNSEQHPLEFIQGLTEGLGADVVIEAVGVPATFELAVELVRPGGHVANIGVHGAPATLHLEKIWDRDVTITTGLVDAYSTPTLLRLVASGDIDPQRFITHTFRLDECMTAYDVFGRADETGALKVVLTA
jgi:alcohol dehydrogenase